MLLEFCFVILCLCAVFIFLSIWGSDFEFCGRDRLAARPANAKNAKQNTFRVLSNFIT